MFEAVLEEHKIPMPDLLTAVRTLAREVAKAILDESLSPEDGGRQIAELSYRIDAESDELRDFSGMISDFDDFGDRVRLDFYGEVRCAEIREDLQRRMVEAAAALVERAG
jgi:hypothetical protein